MNALPNLDDKCGKYLTYRDFIECGETWRSLYIDNVPIQFETYSALERLAVAVLDPVIDNFGEIQLTYGVACLSLTRRIDKRIAPRLDQHAGHELSANGTPICDRGGVACDFEVGGVDSLTVAKWLVGNTDFDRLYYYEKDRPIHVSSAAVTKGQIVRVIRKANSQRMRPSVISRLDFLNLNIEDEEIAK